MASILATHLDSSLLAVLRLLQLAVQAIHLGRHLLLSRLHLLTLLTQELLPSLELATNCCSRSAAVRRSTSFSSRNCSLAAASCTSTAYVIAVSAHVITLYHYILNRPVNSL